MPGEPALVAALEARLTKFESQLKEAGKIAEREVSKIEGRFSKMNPGSSFLTGFAKAAIGAFSLERALSGVINTIQTVGKIGDVAARVGITAEQLQELQFALRQSGGEAAQAAPALERFSVAVSKAASGGGPLARFLRDNNVALTDQNGKLRSNAELLSELANLIKNAATPQERLNIAVQFFGRDAGPAMVTALSNGSAGLVKLANDARDAGAVLRNEMVKEAQELNDKWDKLVDSFTKKGQSAIIAGVRTVGEFLDKLDQWATKVLPILKAINQFNPVQLGLNAAGLGEGTDFDQRFHFGDGLAKGPTRFTVTPDPNRRTNTQSLGKSAGIDAFGREIAQVQKSIAVMEAETAAIDQGAVARDKAKIVAELETAAKAANTAAGMKNTEVTAEQREKIEEVAAAYEKARAASEAANGPLRTFAREAADVNKQLQEAVVGGLKGFEDALIGVIQGTKDAKTAFRDMANAIIADLLRIAIRSLITSQIAKALGAFIPGFGGGGMPISFPGRASGGPVSAGSPYMVGERGPELFVPRTVGNIVPNGGLRGGGTTPSVVIENHGVSIVPGRITADEVRLIASQVVAEKTPRLVAAEIANPNSATAKSLHRNTTSERRR